MRHTALRPTIFLGVLMSVSAYASDESHQDKSLTPSSVIEHSSPQDWRKPDQEMLLHLTTASGEVIFELAPQFAPKHVGNVKTLVAERYFDGLAIIRSQDNYVAQWGDPDAGTDAARSLGKASTRLNGEYFTRRNAVDFAAIGSRDACADTFHSSGQ